MPHEGETGINHESRSRDKGDDGCFIAERLNTQFQILRLSPKEGEYVDQLI
jgi:hypothetical protein